MNILKLLFRTLYILLGIYLAGGYFIPDTWQVTRTMTMHATSQQIYPYVSNFREWENWSPWNASKDPSLEYTYTGPTTGVGAKQTWTSHKMGNGWMQFTAASPETGVAYDIFIDMNTMQSTLHGNIAFATEGDLTTVTWTDSGQANGSFFKRWMSLMIKPMLGKDIDAALSGLKDKVENNHHKTDVVI